MVREFDCTKRLRKIILEENEWVRMQFRGAAAPKISPEICFSYKESLLILNPKTDSKRAFRIIMGIYLIS